MKTMRWFAALAIGALSACNYTEGPCWIDGYDQGAVGAGGGPIVPGVGGFGDVPPAPQGTGDMAPPDCNIVNPTACEKKCLTDYENTAVACGKIADEAQRKSCDANAYATYRKCHDSCAQQENDCKERCKKQCDKIHDRCHEDCNKYDPTSRCHAECNEEYSQCLLECEKDCK